MSESASSSDLDLQSDSPNISWPLNRPSQSGPWTPPKPASTPITKPTPTIDPSNLPNGSKSLSGVSLRSFILGLVLGTCALLSQHLILSLHNPLWRVPFFLAALALFHFLEYYATAAYNPLHANISAFLLSQNGSAYNIAHSAALTECILSRLFLPDSYFQRTSSLFGGPSWQILLGVAMMAIGQFTRTTAMAHAGSNFNHTVQVKRKEGHELVTSGIFSWFRHPSYFGFFWWGLGTQVVLGNVVCFLGYAVVLWRFFASRIRKEEELLVKFFGDDYIKYRSQTWVGIPGIS